MAKGADEILSEFDDLTNYVSRSKHDFFSSNLRRWFAFLDDTSEISSVIKKLESSVDFEEWSREGLKPQSGTGHGRIILPEGRAERLGALLGLFRSFTANEQAAWRFARGYVSSARSIHDNIAELIDQIFAPLAGDLRRRISRELTSTAIAPAADRIVSISHNEQPYKELLDALERVDTALREANDYDDPKDREQRIAELSAGSRLLQATRVRLEAILATLGNALRYLARRFLDTAIGRAASWAIEKVIALVPAAWTYFSGS